MTIDAMRVGDVCQWMQSIAPLHLAESWDNVGLLIGRDEDPVQRIATCLTLSPDVVANVIAGDVDMVITHHPLPFRPLQKIAGDQPPASLLIDLIRHRVAVYSAHTAFDSAVGGINDQWCRRLNIQNATPLVPRDDDADAGGGRFGSLPTPMTVSALAAQCGRPGRVRVTGDPNRTIGKIAVSCGSGGGFLAQAIANRCDAMVTGEATYHTCLEARAASVTVIMTGHFDSERFAMEDLAQRMKEQFPNCDVAAADESDVVI